MTSKVFSSSNILYAYLLWKKSLWLFFETSGPIERRYHGRACRIIKHGCSSIRDCSGNSLFIVCCFSEI